MTPQKEIEVRFYAELNDFLPAGKRQVGFLHRFEGTPSVRDTIEAIGVPHTEIDVILVDDRSVDFTHRLQGGERVSVYPTFERFDVSDVTRLRPAPLRVTRFIADVHLGTLARYLRLLGFDTAWERDLTDENIIDRSLREKRIILTRDRGILRNGRVSHGYWVRTTDPQRQLDEVVRALDLSGAIQPYTCSTRQSRAAVGVDRNRELAASWEFPILPGGSTSIWRAMQDPSHIMQIGTGFFAAKTLLSAVELGLFTELARNPMTGQEIASSLALHRRAIPDFPDTLVALGLLDREGDGPEARYMNTPETAAFLDRKSPDYIGGLLEMMNARLYGFWADLTEALKTGKPQNEVKHSGASMFDTLYEHPERLEQFLNAMQGASRQNFRKLAQEFDFARFQSVCDVGGANAQLACLVAAAHPHLRCITFDLPKVTDIARLRIEREGLSDRVAAVSGDFFADPLPQADVITMGMILHDWNLEKKKQLIQKAFEALPEGGAYIVIERLIDDARRENAAGLLMSLNMLIEFGDAFDYSGADFIGWCREAGFRRFEILPLEGPSSAAIAYK